MLKNFCVSLFIVFIFSCNDLYKDNSSHNSSIIVNSERNLNSNLFNVIKELRILQLKDENGKDFYFDLKPKKIIKYNGNIYIKPNDFQIIQFDSTGVYKSRISLAESKLINHKEITDFIVDENMNNIILHDFQKQRLSVYDLNLNFLYTIKVGYNFTAFEKYKDHFYLFTSKHRNKVDDFFYDYDIIVTDTNFNLLNTFLPFEHEKFPVMRIKKLNPFYITENNLFFNDVVSDTIYKLTHDTIVSDVFYNYDNKTLPSNIRKGSHEALLNYIQDDQTSINEFDFLANTKSISENYIISSYNNGKRQKYIITNKNYDTVLEYQSSDKNNDLGMIFENNLFDSHTDRFITGLSIENFIIMYGNNELNQLFNSQEKLFIDKLQNQNQSKYIILSYEVSEFN